MIEKLIRRLLVMFALDRLIKTVLIRHFFKQPRPSITPPTSINMIQPITRGVHDLRHSLASRLNLQTPSHIRHFWICDAHDVASQQICRELIAAYSQHEIQLIIARTEHEIASKIEKIHAALPHAHGELLLFVDDDVALRPDALERLLPYLAQERAGAVFGMACYTNWRTLWSSMMSIFVNANVLPTYIPVTYMTEPFTITGHCFALRREVFNLVGGFNDMDQRIDDDHELARRLAQHRLRSIQTPLIYDVDNDLANAQAYMTQMHRWFVFPRRFMLPHMSRRDQIISAVGSIGTLLPSMIVLLSLFNPKRYWRFVTILFGMILAAYAHDSRYLKNQTPLKRWWLVPIVVIFAPLQALLSLVRGDQVQWRGQTLNLERDGRVKNREQRA